MTIPDKVIQNKAQQWFEVCPDLFTADGKLKVMTPNLSEEEKAIRRKWYLGLEPRQSNSLGKLVLDMSDWSPEVSEDFELISCPPKV